MVMAVIMVMVVIMFMVVLMVRVRLRFAPDAPEYPAGNQHNDNP